MSGPKEWMEISNIVHGAKEEMLAGLDSVQRSILNGFALLKGGAKVFLSDGTFTVPDGVTEISVYACAAGGAYYAGEYAINRKIKVQPKESIAIKTGADKETQIGSYLRLSKAASGDSLNTDTLGIGITLGIEGNAGEDGSSGYFQSSRGFGGKAGCGGAFGFGGPGGGGGAAAPQNIGGTVSGGRSGSPVGVDTSISIGGETIPISKSKNGTSGIDGKAERPEGSPVKRYYGAGGRGGNAGGFGAGGGRKGSNGSGWGAEEMYLNGTQGDDGKGSPGFVCILWGGY